MNKDLMKFVTALTVRRVAQIKIRSEFKAPDAKSSKQHNLYEIAGELCSDFKDVFLQDAKDLAKTHADDKALSPVKIALMLAESIPLKKSYVDVKDNFPETKDIKRKLMPVKCGHPADRYDKYFALAPDNKNPDFIVPVDEISLQKPPESDFSDIYETIFKKAKKLLESFNPNNFAEGIQEIINLLVPLPIESAKNNYQSLGSYLQTAIMIGSSILNEINQNGPGVMQSDESKLWTLTKIEFNLLGENAESKINEFLASETLRKMNKEVLDAINTENLLIDLHVIPATKYNHIYVLHNKSFSDEIDNKLKPVTAHWQAQNASYAGVEHVDLSTNDLSDFTKLKALFTQADLAAHSKAMQKFIEKSSTSHKLMTKTALKVKASKSADKSEISGYVLVKEETEPDFILDSDKGLTQILFSNKRYNHFWNVIASDVAKKHKMKLGVLQTGLGEMFVRHNMLRLVSFARDFFNTQQEFGLPTNISASIVVETEGGVENNLLSCMQRWNDARNLTRPKIRSNDAEENPFSGFKGSALSLGMIENATRSVIPSEDLKIFFEMLRQVASIAGYRVNHDGIIPLQEQTKPEIFEALHEITHKMKSDKGFNWRPMLYYMLNEKMSENVEDNIEKPSEQAINNLLTTLRYNRWQNIPRLMSRPAHVYLNILAKWLRILELK